LPAVKNRLKWSTVAAVVKGGQKFASSDNGPTHWVAVLSAFLYDGKGKKEKEEEPRHSLFSKPYLSRTTMELKVSSSLKTIANCISTNGYSVGNWRLSVLVQFRQYRTPLSSSFSNVPKHPIIGCHADASLIVS